MKKNGFTFKERVQYWFDNRMAKGSLGLIRILVIGSILLMLVVAAVIAIARFNPEQSFGQTLWESFSTIVNAWMPSSEDGSAGYIVMLALAAIGGLFVTSVLIGIISSAIEEKITSLKHGRSKVLERGHTVILGFTPGEYTLIEQLVLSAAGRPSVIVVAGGQESDEIKDAIKDNVEIPKNIRLICRQTDIFDAPSLEKLMIREARSVIINPQDDADTVRALLAVSNIVNAERNDRTTISAILSGSEYQLPLSIARRHNITTLQTREVLARLIAHSCTQSGLSRTFREVFNFEGAEFYLADLPQAEGMTFAALAQNMKQGIVLGIRRDGAFFLTPSSSEKVKNGDRILVFAEDRQAVAFPDSADSAALPEPEAWEAVPEAESEVVIIGYNEELKTLLHELPENVTRIRIAGLSAEQKEAVRKLAGKCTGTDIEIYDPSLKDEDSYKELMEGFSHAAILSDWEKPEEEADMEVIFHILYLRDVRLRFGRQFSITAQMCRGKNEELVRTSDETDYIVTSNMSSLFLAQLSESPELIEVFTELLSNTGSELYIRTAGQLHCSGEHSVRDIRGILCAQGYTFFGTAEEEGSRFCLDPEETLLLEESGRLIVISQN